jgi:L-fucose isomerase-like protein
MKKNMRFAVMFGNRGFFPGEVIASAQKEMVQAITEAGYEALLMDNSLTRWGAVETVAEARQFEAFLKQTRPDGVIICLPNFGDETSAAFACRNAGVPILVQAYPDNAGEMDPAHRRDAFCGKLSLMDVFCQFKIPFTVDVPHVVHPSDPRFTQQLHDFAGICRVVNGLRQCTLGVFGARTSAFKTVRYDEIALQKVGITVETIDLSEVFAKIKAIPEQDPSVLARIQELRESTDCSAAPDKALMEMSRLSLVIDQYIKDLDLRMVAIRCWNEIEMQLGCAPCAIMKYLGERGIPAACEADVCNAVMMYALSLASDSPSTLLDWNNNVGKEPDKCILFHCGPVPRQLLTNDGHMIEHVMFAKSYGAGCGWGPVEGRLKPGEISYASCKTENGKLVAYMGNARILDEAIEKEFFGCAGVAQIDHLQEKLCYFGVNAFRHHVAISQGHVAQVLREAFGTYLGYDCVDLP